MTLCRQGRMSKTIHGLLIWFILALCCIYAFSLNTAAAVFSDVIKKFLQTTDFGISVAAGTFILGFASMQIPAGYLLDRYNARYIVSTALLVFALGNIAASHANSIYTFSLANLIQGMGASFNFIAATILISQWFPAKMFPIMIGLTETLAFIVTGLLHYFLVIELEKYDWQRIYHYFGIYGFTLFILAVLFVKTPATFQLSKNISLRKSLATVCKNGQIWLCVIALGTSFGIVLAYGGLWYLPIQHFYAVEHSEAALIGGMIFFGIGIGTPILGWFSNYVKSRKLVLHLSLILGNMGLIMAIYLPHYLINTYLIIKIVTFLTGFLLSGSTLFYTMISELSSNQTRGIAFSLTNISLYLFNSLMLLVPFLFITVTSKEFFTYLWVLPISILVSLLLLYFIKETYPSS